MITSSARWVKAASPARLAVMPRPRGGEDLRLEISALRNDGVDVLVSLLESHEIRELELKDEGTLCAEHGISFVSHPIADRGVPQSRDEFAALVTRLLNELQAGKAVAVHCRAGIGRTGVTGACILHGLGMPVTEVFQKLSEARGVTVPDTEEQVKWVQGFAQHGQGAA
jgi:protein-tyrosine phosphatase